MRKGFSLIEMLVVIGIIAVLIAASLGGYAAFTKAADKTKCQELVANVATALTALYQKEGNWPRRLAIRGGTDGKLDAETARALKGYLTLDIDSATGKVQGYDRFGIVSPWAVNVLKRSGKAVTLSTQVSSSKRGPQTVDDHILHYALDLDGDGIIDGAMVGGERVDVRATAIVWCAGKDGYMEAYSTGLRRDDVYSWTQGQTKNVK